MGATKALREKRQVCLGMAGAEGSRSAEAVMGNKDREAAKGQALSIQWRPRLFILRMMDGYRRPGRLCGVQFRGCIGEQQKVRRPRSDVCRGCPVVGSKACALALAPLGGDVASEKVQGVGVGPDPVCILYADDGVERGKPLAATKVCASMNGALSSHVFLCIVTLELPLGAWLLSTGGEN